MSLPVPTRPQWPLAAWPRTVGSRPGGGGAQLAHTDSYWSCGGELRCDWLLQKIVMMSLLPTWTQLTRGKRPDCRREPSPGSRPSATGTRPPAPWQPGSSRRDWRIGRNVINLTINNVMFMSLCEVRSREVKWTLPFSQSRGEIPGTNGAVHRHGDEPAAIGAERLKNNNKRYHEQLAVSMLALIKHHSPCRWCCRGDRQTSWRSVWFPCRPPAAWSHPALMLTFR